ncbi:hypothetical protein [Catenulispora subtropica]|uniref:Uncharacterized protein n=1 Tax=Catenulispora subtropica TaxID=450798 RepID=A0ABP5DUW1_9ACTN
MSDNDKQLHHPGEIVPESGIYECDCGKNHEFNTDVKGHRFPPMHHECSGGGWKLREATQHPV